MSDVKDESPPEKKARIESKREFSDEVEGDLIHASLSTEKLLSRDLWYIILPFIDVYDQGMALRTSKTMKIIVSTVPNSI
jgi:hypothetical protein